MSEHDPHLLAALRHAPDRDAAPPPQVTARILAAARDAVRPAAGASLRQRLATWLVQPQVGAAFATLALATVLGVMWSTHEVPEPASTPVAPPRAAQGVAAQAESAVAVPAVPAVPAPPAPALAPSTMPPAPPAERRTMAKAERQQADVRESSAKGLADARPAPAPAPPEALAKADAAPSAPSVPSAPPPPAVAPTPLAEPARRARDERVAAAHEVGALAGSRAAAPAALALAPRPSPPDPLQALEAGGLDAWVWNASGVAGERAHGQAQRALWIALRQATQGHWQAVAAAQPLVPWLLLRHGSQGAVLWLMDDALYISISDAQASTWRAPVSAEQAREWQRAVSSW